MTSVVGALCVTVLVTQALLCAASGRSADMGAARSLLADPIPAGSPCSLNDLCSGSPMDYIQQNELCPADPKTKTGVCPPIPAGESCNPKDMCATSATTSALCPAATGDSLNTPYCPTLALDATCSALAGQCNETQWCNAPLPTTNPIYDPTVGVCLTYVAAGASCFAGYDVCSLGPYGADYCSSATCLALRAGARCKVGDKCRTGTAGSVACTATAESGDAQCPVQVADAACLLGDYCTGTQVCNAIGDSPGKCVDVKIAYGGQCSKGTDFCPAKMEDAAGNMYDAAVVCSSTKCPLASAGDSCNSAAQDLCNDGSGTGAACPTSNACPRLGPGAKCFATDECGQDAEGNDQACNAQGTSEGVCKTPIAAGKTCVANTDVCESTGSVCTSGTCPLVPAGAECNVADLCSSGAAGGAQCVKSTDANTDHQLCPPLAVGLACSALDLCVRGSVCVGAKLDGTASGVCTVNSKALAMVPVFSNATVVPAVNSIAKLTAYANADAFNATERTRFVNTLEANILAKIHAVTNVTITRVTTGSVVVANTVAFTGANSGAALAGQSALTSLLQSSDVSSIFGSSFGTVTVSNVTKANSTNPTHSGSVATGLSWTLGAALVITALGLSF